jgi:hypothetical protein
MLVKLAVTASGTNCLGAAGGVGEWNKLHPGNGCVAMIAWQRDYIIQKGKETIAMIAIYCNNIGSRN